MKIIIPKIVSKMSLKIKMLRYFTISLIIKIKYVKI